MYSKLIDRTNFYNFKRILYSRFSISNIILFIYIINIQISYSYGSNDSMIYTYENITDYIRRDKNIHYSRFIRAYNKNRTVNKTAVLKFKNRFNLSYYCKDDICVEIDRELLPIYIEIPDKKGNIKGYISKSHRYNEDLKLISERNIWYFNRNTDFIYNCTSNSQCLTNKCIDGVCIFNEENPFEFCTDIYINLFFFRFSYMHCGKPINDICKKNKDCGSENCQLKENINTQSEEYICGMPPNGPSDSDAITGFINLIRFVATIFIILCITFCFK